MKCLVNCRVIKVVFPENGSKVNKKDMKKNGRLGQQVMQKMGHVRNIISSNP